MARIRLSEKEKVYWICLLFPLFWPFLPVLIVLDIIELIKNGVSAMWRKIRLLPKENVDV